MNEEEVELSSEKQEEEEMRHRDQDGGWAWMVLACACLYQAIVGLVYTTGLFNMMFLEEFGKSRQTTAWIGAVLSSSANIYGPLAAFIHDRVGGRMTVLIGTLIGFTGCLLASFARNFIWLFFTFGVMFGLGSGISLIAWVLTIGAYFKKYRNFAYGIASGSVGLGVIILSPLIQFLEREYGWRGCIFIVSAIYLNNLAVALVFLPIRQQRPAKVSTEVALGVEDKLRSNEIRRTDWVTSSILSLASIASKSSSKHGYSELSRSRLFERKRDMSGSDFEHSNSTINGLGSIRISQRKDSLLRQVTKEQQFVRNVSFDQDESYKVEHTQDRSLESKRQQICRILFDRRLVVFYLNMMCNHGSSLLVYLHFPDLFRSQGTSDGQLSVIMITSGVASMFCRALVGLTSNSKDIGVLILYFGCGIISATFMVLCPVLAKSFAGQMVFALFFSFYGNAYNSLMPGMTLELCSLEDLPVAFGIALLLCGISGTVGPPLGGWLYDLSGNYTLTFYVAGALCMAGNLIMLLIPMLGRAPRIDHNPPQKT